MSKLASIPVDMNTAENVDRRQLFGPSLSVRTVYGKILLEDYRVWNVGIKLFLQPGFQAVAVYRFGTWTQLVRPRFLRLLLRIPYIVAFVIVRNVYVHRAE